MIDLEKYREQDAKRLDASIESFQKMAIVHFALFEQEHTENALELAHRSQELFQWLTELRDKRKERKGLIDQIIKLESRLKYLERCICDQATKREVFIIDNEKNENV